jgi:hypothetical protein
MHNDSILSKCLLRNLFLQIKFIILSDRFCGIVVRVPDYRSRSPGSIPGATTFSEK